MWIPHQQSLTGGAVLAPNEAEKKSKLYLFQHRDEIIRKPSIYIGKIILLPTLT
jgi:hypothetical protein